MLKVPNITKVKLDELRRKFLPKNMEEALRDEAQEEVKDWVPVEVGEAPTRGIRIECCWEKFRSQNMSSLLPTHWNPSFCPNKRRDHHHDQPTD